MFLSHTGIFFFLSLSLPSPYPGDKKRKKRIIQPQNVNSTEADKLCSRDNSSWAISRIYQSGLPAILKSTPQKFFLQSQAEREPFVHLF